MKYRNNIINISKWSKNLSIVWNHVNNMMRRITVSEWHVAANESCESSTGSTCESYVFKCTVWWHKCTDHLSWLGPCIKSRWCKAALTHCDYASSLHQNTNASFIFSTQTAFAWDPSYLLQREVKKAARSFRELCFSVIQFDWDLGWFVPSRLQGNKNALINVIPSRELPQTALLGGSELFDKQKHRSHKRGLHTVSRLRRRGNITAHLLNSDL